MLGTKKPSVRKMCTLIKLSVFVKVIVKQDSTTNMVCVFKVIFCSENRPSKRKANAYNIRNYNKCDINKLNM